MTERLLAPSDPREAKHPAVVESLDAKDMAEGRPWDRNYVDLPAKRRLGIAISGGGIRSASYCLGVLQVLRRTGILSEAKYLTCVSGGGYISIAHAVMIDQTLKRTRKDELVPVEQLFAGSAPWAPGSPEEQHLRDHLDYLAPGAAGRVWAAANAFYGMAKHLLVFIAAFFIMSYALGLAYGHWIGPVLRHQASMSWTTLTPYAWLTVGLLLLSSALLLVRQHYQRREHPSELALSTLQGWVLVAIAGAAATALLLIALPSFLVWLSYRQVPRYLASLFTLSALTLVGGKVVSALARRGVRRRIVAVLSPILTPLLILLPLVGFTYWCTQSALPSVSFQGTEAGSWFRELLRRPQTWFLLGSLLVLLAGRLLDDVTPVPHLYYRERLATAFVGRRRRRAGSALVRYEQPPWADPILLSHLETGAEEASFPRLVICATANLSGDVPRGRSGTGFTFEKDFCGSPLTGYVSTNFLEDLASSDALTIPALMAISGAAVAPSMGKMTRPDVRFLMSMFDLRLGVWLPNPRPMPARLSTKELRRLREDPGSFDQSEAPASLMDERKTVDRYRRQRWKPGSLYVLREAFGLNNLGRRFLYMTDGGHFDNLGLVELLRRGCGRILCFDAAGDDLEHFNTLSEAIALARADLGVDVRIDLTPLRPTEGSDTSPSDHAVGEILYPDGTKGVLIFCKAAIPQGAPPDVQAFRQIERRFPTHPTTDQFFDERTFESYRALGRMAAEGAVVELAHIQGYEALAELVGELFPWLFS
jgi:hypothetical protein